MDWKTSQKPVDYEEAVAAQERRVAEIASGRAPELAWLLTHPPLYTAGSSAKPGDLRKGNRFPTYQTGRGGQWTYHGPGQRVCYLMLDLNERGRDLRRYVRQLENWLIATLAEFDVEGFTRDGRTGVWTRSPQGEAKIAAIGIRVRKWVTYHGVSLNVNPDLSHYAGIIPCGIKEYGVTSLKSLGIKASMKEVDSVLKKTFKSTFGAV